MARDKNSNLLRKTAVLAGLTILFCGAEASRADAATTSPQTDSFSGIGLSEHMDAENTSDGLQFQQFDPTLGTLTGVNFALDSSISTTGSFSASVIVDAGSGVTIGSLSGSTNTIFDNSSINGLMGAADAAFYTGTSNISVELLLSQPASLGSSSTVSWEGSGDEAGLTLTYDYTPTTPLPAALPLFGTGLAGIALTAWRSRRKRKTAEQV